MPVVDLAPKGFRLGQVSDFPADQLPPGAAYRMVDWIPQADASLRRRGPWAYGSADKIGDGVTSITGMCWAPFDTDPNLVFIGQNGKVYMENTFGPGTGTLLASGGNVSEHPPVWHRQAAAGRAGIVVLPLARGVTGGPVVQKVNFLAVYALNNLGGTPPIAAVAHSWGDYLILANGFVGINKFPNSLWFSAVGDPQTWNTSSSFISVPEEIIGIASLQNQLLVFGSDGCHIILGDTPPPGGNMTLRKWQFRQGLSDPKGLVRWKDQVIWANTNGIWKTDGATLTDLTEQIGESRRWRDYMRLLTSAGVPITLNMGIWAGKLVVNVNQSNTYRTWIIDLDQNIAYEFDHIRSGCMAPATAFGLSTPFKGDELFFGRVSEGRVGLFSSIWDFSGQPADPDSFDIVPKLETPFYKLGGSGQKRWRRVWLNYSLSETVTGANTIKVSWNKDDGAIGTYTALTTQLKASSTSTKKLRLPLSLAKKSDGMQFKIELVSGGSTSDARLFGLEADVTALDPGRDGDKHN